MISKAYRGGQSGTPALKVDSLTKAINPAGRLKNVMFQYETRAGSGERIANSAAGL
jgi:hypothetical protein